MLRSIGSRPSWLRSWPIAAALAPMQEGVPSLRPPPRLDYRVECVVDGVQDRLVVDLEVRGLDPANHDVAFELPGWGEAWDLDEYYVTRVRGTPPVRHDLVNRFYWRPELPERWDGALALHYELPVVALQSFAHAHRGLLPWRMPTYVHAFTSNTLLRLLVGADRQDANRHLELVAPAGWSIASGWGGVTPGRQALDLAPAADNTVIVFGRAVATHASDDPANGLAVVQFGEHDDRTRLVFDLAARLRAAYAASTGAAAPASELLVITEPGLGGTHVEGAITLGHPALEGGGRAGSEPRPDVGTLHFVAHELFHAWLPGVLAPAPALADRGLEWFFEGFTDYFSLWHLAAIDAITPRQFGDHLRYLERYGRESAAWGKVAFADPRVNWREPDAERVAYKGGMLLAFHLDVELRERGEPGLPMLFRDLIRENGGVYDLAALQKWCEANGLEESWARHVAAPALPDVAADLARITGDDRELDPRFFRFEPPAK